MHEICLIPNNNLLIWKKKKKIGAQALSKQAKKKPLVLWKYDKKKIEDSLSKIKKKFLKNKQTMK